MRLCVTVKWHFLLVGRQCLLCFNKISLLSQLSLQLAGYTIQRQMMWQKESSQMYDFAKTLRTCYIMVDSKFHSWLEWIIWGILNVENTLTSGLVRHWYGVGPLCNNDPEWSADNDSVDAWNLQYINSNHLPWLSDRNEFQRSFSWKWQFGSLTLDTIIIYIELHYVLYYHTYCVCETVFLSG